MDFKRSKIGSTHWWVWVVVTLLIMAVTASLGRWQLDRAQQKLDLQHAIEEQLSAPVLTEQDLEITPALWGEIHRRVSLQGYWMHQHTLFLDNRIEQGRAGFWVMTPLLLDDQSAVLVQRGWVPLDPKGISAVPKLSEPKELVRIQGRLIPPPSKWLELNGSEATPESGTSQIRHNIDITQLRQLWGYSIVAVVLQSDPSDAEMKREWKLPASTVGTNQGYAFQWFALCAAVFVIALWFLIIQPLRHGST
jgi:surfeit locus 1 family protein